MAVSFISGAGEDHIYWLCQPYKKSQSLKTCFYDGANRRKPPLLVDPTRGKTFIGGVHQRKLPLLVVPTRGKHLLVEPTGECYLYWWSQPEKPTFIGDTNRRKPPLLVDPTEENHLYWLCQPEKITFIGGTNRGNSPLLVNPTGENHLYWWTKPEKTTFIGGPNLGQPPLLVDQTWENNLYWWTKPKKTTYLLRIKLTKFFTKLEARTNLITISCYDTLCPNQPNTSPSRPSPQASDTTWLGVISLWNCVNVFSLKTMIVINIRYNISRLLSHVV